MIIKSIELADYRNYDTLTMEFDKGTNILYGDNAQGKTNILEAVFVAATTKSHRGSKDREIINFHREEAHIRTYLEKDGVESRVDMHLRKNKSKGIAIDGQKIKKAAACAMWFCSLLRIWGSLRTVLRREGGLWTWSCASWTASISTV